MLGPEVVELEHDEVSCPAVHAAGLQPLGDRRQLPMAAMGLSDGLPEPPRPVPLSCAPPMTARAHHLASRDLIHQPRKPHAVTHELADVARLRPDVIELEDDWIGLAAVCARCRREDVEDVSRRSGTPGLERGVRLPAMNVTARGEVITEAGFAPVLVSRAPAGERIEDEVALTAATSAGCLGHEHMFA